MRSHLPRQFPRFPQFLLSPRFLPSPRFLLSPRSIQSPYSCGPPQYPVTNEPASTSCWARTPETRMLSSPLASLLSEKSRRVGNRLQGFAGPWTATLVSHLLR